MLHQRRWLEGRWRVGRRMKIFLWPLRPDVNRIPKKQHLCTAAVHLIERLGSFVARELNVKLRACGWSASPICVFRLFGKTHHKAVRLNRTGCISAIAQKAIKGTIWPGRGLMSWLRNWEWTCNDIPFSSHSAGSQCCCSSCMKINQMLINKLTYLRLAY